MKLTLYQISVVGLILVTSQCVFANTIYFQDWESGTGGWSAKTGSVIIKTFDILGGDPPPPSGFSAQEITRNNFDGYYYYSGSTPLNPLQPGIIPVNEGQTYSAGAWIFWGGGEVPFQGIQFYNSGLSLVNTYWIVGSSKFNSNPIAAPPITPVLRAYASQWHWYSNSFAVPTGNDISYIRILDKIWGYGDPSYHVDGPSLSYFDNITVTTVPVPGALMLGGLGIGLVRWIRRRKSMFE